jgi:hypothetical protein
VIGAIAGGSAGEVLGRSFAAATHPGWWVIAVLGAGVVILGVITTSPWAQRTADPFREAAPGAVMEEQTAAA